MFLTLIPSLLHTGQRLLFPTPRVEFRSLVQQDFSVLSLVIIDSTYPLG